MMKYVNSFSVGFEKDRKIFIVNLLQQMPELTEDGSIGDEAKSTLLDSFVMDADVALGLVSTMVSMINDTDEDVDELDSAAESKADTP